MARNYSNGQLVKALTIAVPRVAGNPLMGTKRVWRKPTSDNRVFVTMNEHQMLERNKYAPWGRGELGGKPVPA